MGFHAIYKNQVYRLDISADKLEILSNSNESVKYGFRELKFEQGFLSKVIYIKEVEIQDLVMAYELKYKIIYKEREYVPWTVGKFLLKTNKIYIDTTDEQEAKKYGFEKIEQFLFKKEVLLDEVDALIEMKSPILKFQNKDEEFTRIEQKDIRSYLEKLIE